MDLIRQQDWTQELQCMRPKLLSLLIVVAVALALTGSVVSGATQDPAGRPGQTKPPQKPVPEPVEKTQLTTPIQDNDEAMRQALTNLSTQIGLLAEEMKKLRRQTERNSGTMELLLNEDRLAKAEDKIQEATNYKAQLDAREQDIQRRMRNIQGELLLRGGLRRDESEAAIRSELQRALEDVRSQQAAQQARLAELVEQATRLRTRVESLRKRLEVVDAKNEKEDK
jgi:hypothetical protein